MDRSFYSALVHLSDFYGIVMKEDQFENIALHAWDHIGNRNTRMYIYTADVCDNKIDLPCNADVIEAVFGSSEDHATTDGIDSWSKDFITSNIEEGIEDGKSALSHFYGRGGYVKYERVGNTLYFPTDGESIRILYKGPIVDEEGLPMLNFKEMDAIAKYCAYVHTQKQAMITKDKATFELAMMLKQQWQFAVDDARTPIYLNQNEVNQILDAQASWDRKRFGRSFKPIS